MATKPKAILSTHDGREVSPITRASNVLFENGQTAQDILNDRQDAMISPVIENSSSMFKVGQGDDVDYSANVVNGAYEGMVLKGKTMVNCIQEPSSQDVVLPYEFEEGQYVTINDTKESGALGVELKGQTLVNIDSYYAKSDFYIFGADSIDEDGYIQLTAKGTWVNAHTRNNSLVKPNTKYAIIVDIKENTLDSSMSNALKICTNTDTLDSVWSDRYGIDIAGGVTGRLFFTATTSDKVSGVKMLQRAYVGNSLKTGHIKYRWMIIEYQEGMENWDIPYFRGMASVKMPVLTTTGKNLFDKEAFYNDWKGKQAKYIYKETVDGEDVLKIHNLNLLNADKNGFKIFVKKDVPLTLTFKCKKAGTADTNAVLTVRHDYKTYKDVGSCNSDVWTERSATFTPTRNYITICSAYIQNDYYYIKDIQLEQGTQKTPYEPYKSSILSLPEEVVLRSLPNGVCDTFNTRTGVYTQRIGEVVLDGSDSAKDWMFSESNNTFRTSFNKHGIIPFQGNRFVHVISDKYTTLVYTDDWNSGAFVSMDTYNRVVFRDDRFSSLIDWHNSLKQDAITVQYILETPVTTKINLPSTLKSWNTTTHIYSEIPENSLYPILSHSNPSYPVILKPSTKYSIVANSYSNDHTNSAINFNLGGATASTTVGNRVTTITTPSTLSNELLTMSGRGNKLNNVMVIEGDVVGDESYFEGICDCKSPILSNIGKNLYSTIYLTDNANVDKIRLKANVRYTLTNSVAFSPQNRFKFRVYDLKHNLLDDGNLVTKDKDLYYNSGSKAFCNNGNKDYIECSFTPKIDCYISITSFNSGVDSNRDYHIQLEEGSTVTTYEPYKSNILSCNGDKIELTEDMFEQGGVYFTKGQSFADATNNTAPDRIRLKTLLNLKPNTTYRVAINNAYKVGVQLYNNEESAVSDTGWVSDATFTTKGGENAVALVIRKLSSTANISMSDFKNIKLQLSEVDKTIVLRSLPNGVCDTLNVETGEYVQRIGEVVLDGTETNWSVTNEAGWENTPNTIAFGLTFTPKALAYATDVTSSVVCDKFSTITADGTWGASGADKEGISINQNSRFDIRIERTKLPDESLTGFKQWLSQNPITVQYELEVPIVKTVDLSGFPFSYENGHVQLSSGSIEQSLTPKVEYSVATNRNGQIRSNQKMVERHQKQLDQLQAIILANLVNSQYNQTLTTLKYELSRV